ncbi:hypothetical protein [Tardiphaga sp.]|uniref:hypothetical protein n=1 Tax=Tardiphaga sp. TaxID=1926292 RepID=UPI00263391FB|nr:hypothetical protein [Tardiphaga sp.]
MAIASCSDALTVPGITPGPCEAMALPAATSVPPTDASAATTFSFRDGNIDMVTSRL